MTDTERKFPFSDAELLTATGEELQSDWSERIWESCEVLNFRAAFAAQRDAIVRAATAKVRAEYACTPGESHELVGRIRRLEELLMAERLEAERLRAQLATARTDGAREALTRLMSEMRVGPAMRWRVEDVESFCDEEYPAPAPHEEAVMLSDGSVIKPNPAVRATGWVRMLMEADGIYVDVREDAEALLRDTDTIQKAVQALAARVAGREP